MYPNVKAEFARKGLTLAEVSGQMGITVGTLSLKMKKGGFTLAEARKIKQIIGSQMPIEELFEEAEK